ncbi:MAG: hypothetical protein ACLQU4_09450 [Limisphaerales bacterium]
MLDRIPAIIIVGITGWAVGASAAQIQFDFSKDAVDQTPPGFLSLVTGRGEAAHWKVVEEQVPPILAPLEPNAPGNTAKRAVLTVQSFNLDEDHFPVLLYTNEIFSDFTLTTRFKLAGGIVEPSAGLIFRAQDQSNYYVLRASAEGNLLWYRVVGGQSYVALGIGVKVPMPKDVWRELRVECAGSQMRCYLDGHLAIPPPKVGAPTNELAINDTTFSHGQVGFWTKADSKCFFVDAGVRYTPRVPYVQVVINNVLKEHPALLGLKVYANKDAGLPVVIGSMNEHDFGAVGTRTEADVIARASVYYLKADKTVEITMPLRDRNGEVVAAIAVKLKTFHGETQSTAVTRATMVKNEFERQIATMEDLRQ